MEKLYLGVDSRKRGRRVTVLDADGNVLESRQLGTEKWELLEFFGQVCHPSGPLRPCGAGFVAAWTFDTLLTLCDNSKVSIKRAKRRNDNKKNATGSGWNRPDPVFGGGCVWCTSSCTEEGRQ